MRKVGTKKNMKGLFGFLATFAMALGIGVSLSPRDVKGVKAADVSITLDVAALGGVTVLKTGNYDGGAERLATVEGVEFGSKAITVNNNTKLQGQANNAVLYNISTLGKIKSVTINSLDTARATTLYGGTSRLVDDIATNYEPEGTSEGSKTGTGTWDLSSKNYTYFAVKRTSGSASYWASVVVTFEQASDSVVSALGVDPTSKSYTTSDILQEADFAVSVTKDGVAGTNADYTAQIGVKSGSEFVGSPIVWGTTKPKLTDETIQFKANYPSTAGGSEFLIAEVELEVSAPAATSVIVSSAGDAEIVRIGKTLQLEALVLPLGADEAVTWESSDDLVATVSSSGLVTGVAEGNVSITAKSSTPGIEDSIELTVPEAVVYDDGEDFEGTTISTGYGDGTFTGSTGIVFNYYGSRDQENTPITGKGLMFRRIADNSRLDFTLSNGLSAIKFDWIKAFTGSGNRQVGVFINGIEVATTEALDKAGEVQTFEHAFDTPYSGSVSVSIKNKTSNQVVIDNIEWKNGPVATFGTLASLKINTDAVKKSYYEGQSLSLSGLVAMAVDTVGLEKNVTAEVVSDPADGYVFKAADAGTKTITVSYTEGTTVNKTFDVTVTAIVQPEHLVANVGVANTDAADSGTIIPVGTDLKSVFIGEEIELLESALVQIDAGDEQSRMYYGGSSNAKGGVQPLKFGSSNGKGNVKFTFGTGVKISKVTLYVARLGTGSTVAKMQVNGAAAQNIGAASTADVMHAPYVFEGSFGNKLTIRNDSNIATYLYGIDIEYVITTAYEDAKEFADWVMFQFAGDEEGMTSPKVCEDTFYEAWGRWDELSLEAKESFKEHEDFAGARQRFLNWILANGGTSIDDLDSDEGGIRRTEPKKDTSLLLTATVLIGVIGLTTLLGYFLLKKRETNK